MESVIRELARYLNLNYEEVRQRVGSYSVLQAAELWRKEKPDTRERVEQFYKDADFYLYELISWNYGNVAYQQRIESLLHYRGKKILEVGAGIGSLCISLAYAGNEVTYYDISPKLSEFARQRFSERGLNIPIAENLKSLRDFDIVVANDVLEHIHKDALPGLLKEMANVLADGGFVYHVDNFEQQDIFPMHFDHREYLEKMCIDAGFSIRANGDLVKGGKTNGVQVGIPTRNPGLPNDEILFGFIGLQKPPGTLLTKIHAPGIDNARNLIIAELKRDWLFFMDDDQTFPPETLMRLLSWDLPIVSGLYFKSPGKPVPHAYGYDHGEARKHPEGQEQADHFYMAAVNEVAAYLSRFGDQIKDGAPTALLPATRQDLIEVDGVGAGCLLVHRRVFEAIEKPYFQCNPGTPIGEDFYFCRKAQAAGFKIYVDPGILCGHRQKDLIGYRHFLSWFTHASDADGNGKWPYPWNEQ
mgnify:FL=1